MTIPQMEPWLGEEEAAAVNDYMRSGGWLMEHDKTRQFESIIADYTGASHCIVTVNGTVSLTLAALACDVKAGRRGDRPQLHNDRYREFRFYARRKSSLRRCGAGDALPRHQSNGGRVNAENPRHHACDCQRTLPQSRHRGVC